MASVVAAAAAEDGAEIWVPVEVEEAWVATVAAGRAGVEAVELVGAEAEVAD